MSFKRYWARLSSKNSYLERSDTKMAMTVEEFRYWMKDAFNEGKKSSELSEIPRTKSLWEMVFGRKA